MLIKRLASSSAVCKCSIIFGGGKEPGTLIGFAFRAAGEVFSFLLSERKLAICPSTILNLECQEITLRNENS